MNPAAPLLFFDSGVGGLSVLQPTRALLPNAPIVYVADNAGFPYGARSEEDIAARVPGTRRSLRNIHHGMGPLFGRKHHRALVRTSAKTNSAHCGPKKRSLDPMESK